MRLRLFLLPILLAALASAQTAGFTTTQSMQNETRATAALLEKLHISKKDMGSVDMNSVVKTYCENLDGAKMYFTAEEVDEFVNRYGKTLDLYLQRGNLTPAFEIYSLFKKKVNERTVSNLAALDQPIDLTQPGTFPVDRKKAEWPANQEAADALWARRLRLDMLSELLGEDRTGSTKAPKDHTLPEITPEKTKESAARLKKRYDKSRTYLNFDQNEVEEIFLNSYSSQYDPHSTFFSQQSLEEFEIAMRNSLVGIGATLSDEDGYCVIKDILPGGPLDLSHQVKPGDKIIAVTQYGEMEGIQGTCLVKEIQPGGPLDLSGQAKVGDIVLAIGRDGEMEDVVGMPLSKVVERVSGKKGTTVRLLIQNTSGDLKKVVLKCGQAGIGATLSDKVGLAASIAIERINGKKGTSVRLLSINSSGVLKKIELKRDLTGIGATLSDEDGSCVIKDILQGGPLDLSQQLKVGDRIIAVGQVGEPEDIVGMRLSKAISRIRGKQGSSVGLLVDMAAGGRKTVVLKRDQIKLVGQMASAKAFEVTNGNGTVMLGVIDLPAFYGKNSDGSGSSPSADIEQLINKLKAMGMKALIMDLRKNGGGLLTEAVDISGLFIPKGSVLQVRGSDGRSEDYRDEDEKVAWNGPLIVLTSKLSASASEIFAGAMHDHRRAIIVGDTTTHGKGSVQNIIELSRFDKNLKSAVKVTIQKWYAPSGSSIQLKGVPADIVVPSVYSVLPVAESDLDRPLPWDSVTPTLTKADEGEWLKAKISDGLIAQLSAGSARRQSELPEFLTLSRTIDWTKSRQVRKDVSLSLDQRSSERKDDLEFREQIRRELADYAKKAFKVSDVKLDAAIEQEKKEGPGSAAKSKKASRMRDPLEDDDWPEYDIQLQEAVRIATDWTDLLPSASVAAVTSAAQSQDSKKK